jgi:1-aminocyclopropane-1-carboxylate synthase
VEEARRRVTEACVFAKRVLREEGMDCYKRNSADFFVWVDLRKRLPPQNEGTTGFERECRLAKKCVDGGVFLLPREEHAVEPGWWRMVYTMEKEVVEVGMRRLGRVLRGVRW